MSGLPAVKETYEAIVTGVFDDDKEVAVDLGGYQAALALGTGDDARFNPDGKAASERFKRGDVVNVVLAGPAPKPPKVDVALATKGKAAKKKKPVAEDDEDAVDIEGEPEAPTPIVEKPMKHAAHRVIFAPGPEGAVVVLETKTRKVRAIVGGYFSKVGGFDRATQAHRQPGSSFKPFVYSAAIDSGKYTAASRVNDAPEVFDLWKPKNFETTFEGPVLLRHALARSINTVAIRVAYDTTPAVVADFAHKMGIKSELPKEMSLALGSGEVTPFEMTNAYATYATGGLYMDARFVDAIDGKLLPAEKGEQVIRPEVAYVVTNMMQSVVQEGTGVAVKALDIPVAGKTGTSNDARDTWFIGVTPDYAIGVWVGYDDDRPMGSREQGGVTAAPVFVEAMKPMKLQKKSFVKPAKIVEVVIDRATGLLAPEDAPKGLDALRGVRRGHGADGGRAEGGRCHRGHGRHERVQRLSVTGFRLQASGFRLGVGLVVFAALASSVHAGGFARLGAAMNAKLHPPKRVPPVAVGVKWRPARIGSFELGAPLVALAAANLDGDPKRGELYAVTAREVIAYAIVDTGKAVELGRVAFPAADVGLRASRDAMGGAAVDGASLLASSSAFQHALRVTWKGKQLVAEAGPAGVPTCGHEMVPRAPGRNYLDDTPPIYGALCRDMVDRGGGPLHVRAQLATTSKLTVTAIADDGAGAVAKEYAGVGVAFEIADVDRDGTPDVIISGAGAPGDSEAVKVMAFPDDKGTFRKAFTGGVVGVAAVDDGPGVPLCVVAAVRLVGATRIDLWRLD